MLEILLAQSCIQVIVILLQNIIGFVVMYGIFNYIMNGSMVLILIIIFLIEILGIAYGNIIVSYIFKINYFKF